MTFTNRRYRKPISSHVDSALKKVDLLVHGQGVVLFKVANDVGPCSLFLHTCEDSGIFIQMDTNKVIVQLMPSGEVLQDKNNHVGLSDKPGAYYWFSLDSQNQRIHCGIGEPRLETAIYSYSFERDANWESRKLFLESISFIQLTECSIIKLLRDPITKNIPMLVRDTNDLTMDDIASGTYMPTANLSTISQKLYRCISGDKFVLNTPDFPDFVKAIEHSIATPGLWCYERLKQKATEFDKNKPNYAETYLRITLGENNGESPGIPYVMEIWPVGHYSPIHNHGGANAVIRVLNGSIHVSLYPFLGDEIAPFAKADFTRGDVTWISANLNAIHQLKNLDGNKDTCITIQCYMYDEDDTSHYDYFDYLDAEGKKEPYEPDSDMDFIEFKATMKKEWMNRRCPFRWLFCKQSRVEL